MASHGVLTAGARHRPAASVALCCKPKGICRAVYRPRRGEQLLVALSVILFVVVCEPAWPPPVRDTWSQAVEGGALLRLPAWHSAARAMARLLREGAQEPEGQASRDEDHGADSGTAAGGDPGA